MRHYAKWHDLHNGFLLSLHLPHAFKKQNEIKWKHEKVKASSFQPCMSPSQLQYQLLSFSTGDWGEGDRKQKSTLINKKANSFHMNFVFNYNVPTFLVKFFTINDESGSWGTATKQNTDREKGTLWNFLLKKKKTSPLPVIFRKEVAFLLMTWKKKSTRYLLIIGNKHIMDKINGLGEGLFPP